MATSTVEDYLKAILVQEQNAPGDRVSTGQLAVALGVAPGTATSMMKTLMESKLVDYEPYAGVRLTDGGSKLAMHVLRRHRLVELFLVQVMGMGWSEVHSEAEVLEHAVSDRLIDRMDEMLGRPAVDPHGDPIPTRSGIVEEADHPSLLACATGNRLEVTRVIDQRPEFLKLLERHRLMPGRHAQVVSRDEFSETVQIQPEGAEPVQLGFAAASRVLVKPI